jgi:uncharacterized protein YndB with AHSA1/START domain
MGPREITIDAPPERVWEVLADPFAYDKWVVGTRRIRRADDSWPAVGSRLHHTVGVWPLTLRDHSEVLESDAPRRLVLRAKVRPVGVLKVEIDLKPVGDRGTHLMLQEYVEGGPLRLTGKLGDAGAQGRMEIGVRKLKDLVEARASA